MRNLYVFPGVFLSLKALAITLLLILFAGVVFALRPDFDLSAAGWFFREGRFFGSGSGERMLRRFFYYAPLVVLLVITLLWLLPKAGVRVPAPLVPTSRSMVFLYGALLAGPWLLVNVVLKEHSNRPRPNQIIEHSGKSEFRPWYRFDGACQTNCSFVSGEVSTSAWLAAPASLLPPPWNVPAIAGAIAFAAATGALRMAFGGHFLSDVIFAILFTLLVCQLMHRLIMRGRRPQG